MFRMRSTLMILTIYWVATEATDWKEKARRMDENYALVRETCSAKHDITASELKAIENMEIPQTRREKCIFECLLTESGIMDEGKFSRDGLDITSTYLYDDDPENLKIAKAVSKRCEKAVEGMKIDDSCEMAAATIQCLRRTSKHLGGKKFPENF